VSCLLFLFGNIRSWYDNQTLVPFDREKTRCVQKSCFHFHIRLVLLLMLLMFYYWCVLTPMSLTRSNTRNEKMQWKSHKIVTVWSAVNDDNHHRPARAQIVIRMFPHADKRDFFFVIFIHSFSLINPRVWRDLNHEGVSILMILSTATL
jgi:hypothetical protein